MEKLEFEDILLELGDFGAYQKSLLYVFLVPAAFFLPWYTMNIIFMVSVPDHWCNVPELQSSNLSLQQQRDLIAPKEEQSCRMYNLNFSEILDSGNLTIPLNTSTKPCDQGWQYSTADYDATAATQWNMVCDNLHYTSYVLMWYHIGGIIATPLYGSLSDKFGRKLVFFLVVIVTAITNVSSVLTGDFTTFIILKTINGGLMPCIFQLPFIIILELVVPEKRTQMNGMVNCSWSVGAAFVPLIAYLTRSWVSLGLWTSTVTILYFAYWTYLPESPRWLVSQHRYDEAVAILTKIGNKNGVKPDPKQLLAKLEIIGNKLKSEEKTEGEATSPLVLLKYPQLRKTFLIISVCWIADVLAYDGLQLNSINLAGNEFINFFVLVMAEIPGYMTSWYFIEHIGRRWCVASFFLLTGIICLFSTIEFPYGDLVCSLLGKYLGAAAFMATYQQSSELYPTVVRSLGMGISSTIASIVSLFIPYIIYFGTYNKAIPFLIIGGSCLLAGVLATLLPETRNENLPQTINDREQFGKNQRFFSLNRRRSIIRERAESLRMKSVEQIETDK